MKGKIYLVVALRSGDKVQGRSQDVSDRSEEHIRTIINTMAKLIKQPKDLSYLSLNCDEDGTCVIHPDDISRIYVVGTTPKLRELINECF